MRAWRFINFIAVLFTSTPGFACADLGTTGDRWINVMEGVQTVSNELWKFPCVNSTVGYTVEEARLSAYRFDRKHFEFVLVDPAAELKKLDKQKVDLGDTFISGRKQFVRLGQNIGTVAEFSTTAGKFALVAPAGWWQNVDATQPDGYLKINGEVISQVFAKNQSAILCLDDQTLPESAMLGHTIVVFFYYNKGKYAYANWDETKKQRLTKCRNVLQTGPRIIERETDREGLFKEPALSEDMHTCLRKEDKRAGICPPKATTGSQRVILAADNRPGIGSSERRRYYIIFFHGELPLYQIQSILLSDKFYGDGKPEWAVNLAGGNRSGLSVRIEKQYMQYGNVESDLPSLLLVRPTIR
jgi:hypothetical protein